MEAVVGSLLRKGSANVTLAESKLADMKYIGIYFGAHWAPPCRLFTTTLTEWYNSINKDG